MVTCQRARRLTKCSCTFFGAKSSPSVAGYADDLLKSFAGSERAVQVSKQLQELLARGGFELTKWISNSRSVLSVFPVEERAPPIKSLDLKSESLPIDRELGIHWNVEHDTIETSLELRTNQNRVAGEKLYTSH